MPEKHSHLTEHGRAYWWTERLWKAASALPTRTVRIDDIKEFDEDCWFGGRPATCRDVAKHAQRIMDVDMTHPIILSAEGRLMDGGHRVAKAWIEGRSEIEAVRFATDPLPDWIEPEPYGAMP